MEEKIKKIQQYLRYLPAPVADKLEWLLKKNKKFNEMMNTESDKIASDLERALKPYHEKFTRYHTLPEIARTKEDILEELKMFYELEKDKWQKGFVSGGIYHGDLEHIKFLNEVYALQSQSNPLHSDLFPSTTKMEAEIISMVAHLFSKDKVPSVCGTVTSGGTESILLAMKTYRDKALAEKKIIAPEMILPESAHVAFDKAAQYFGIKQIKIPLNENFTIDVFKVKKAINKNTIVIIGSAPSFPHGIIDPIPELSELALKNNIGFHTDCCLGGFIIPFARNLGYNIHAVDFSLKGVTSISIDTHKYGYAAKGTSVLLYRDESLRHYQYFTSTDWPGGLYFSPTLSGSRPGGLSAACWAAMLSIGYQGYMENTKKILETGDFIKKELKMIPELYVFGNPLWVISFSSKTLNIFEVLEQMTKKGWILNGLHKPASVHIALTLRHTEIGVSERFISDLKESVAYVKTNPGKSGGMAPVYGMAEAIPFRGLVSDLLKKTLDVIYRP